MDRNRAGCACCALRSSLKKRTASNSQRSSKKTYSNYFRCSAVIYTFCRSFRNVSQWEQNHQRIHLIFMQKCYKQIRNHNNWELFWKHRSDCFSNNKLQTTLTIIWSLYLVFKLRDKICPLLHHKNNTQTHEKVHFRQKQHRCYALDCPSIMNKLCKFALNEKEALRNKKIKKWVNRTVKGKIYAIVKVWLNLCFSWP